jgi:SAM-dependent methyltransferase
MGAPQAADLIPGKSIPAGKAPGHWVLARLGKRILRPGGVELTRAMLDKLALVPGDRVVEFAPGLGASTRLCLAKSVDSYTAIDRDSDVLARLRARFSDPRARFLLGNAHDTTLAGGAATAVFGEAMLSMQTEAEKLRIIKEAARILEPGGRYALHELCAMPDDIEPAVLDAMQADLSTSVHHAVRLATPRRWRELLGAAGFTVVEELHAPMHLLEPRRIISDEGLARSLKILMNVCRDGEARKRMLGMRAMFRKHRETLQAIALVAIKRAET